ncbi:MAG: glycosyltransferase family 4 protein [Mariniblastus sp.]|nr:glycosyltransferase family 4 protein [Mariniblastus sp.]
MTTEIIKTESTLSDSRRIALVAEKFWPFSGPTELNLGELAAELKRRGQVVQILTSKLDKMWPGLLDYREIPIHRIATGSGPWATLRNARRFSKYLRGAESLDSILVFGINMVTQAVLRTMGQRLPVVVFVDRSLLDGGKAETIPPRQIEALKRSRAVVTDCQELAIDLSRLQGMPPVQIIPTGVTTVEKPPSLSSQSGARAALSEAHPILGVDAGQPLAVTSLTNNNDHGTLDMIRAWSTVIEQYPGAKLWIVGEGHLAARAWQLIVDLNLVHAVIMPGFFDDDAELLLAADLYIYACRAPRADPVLIRAMARQRCVLATSNRWTESFITADDNGLLAPPDNPSALAEAILLAFAKSDLRSRLASSGVQTAKLHFSLRNQADRFLELLQSPADQPCESAL